MTNRKTFFQFRKSRAPQVLAACAANIPALASYVNEATERLVKAGSETGWYGTWQRVVFNVDRNDPFITLPRSIARVIDLDVCSQPVRVSNEFYEFLEAGIGLQPQSACNCASRTCNSLSTFDRGSFPSFKDLDATGNPKILRLYATSNRDVGNLRVLLQGLDQNGNVIRSLDNGFDIQGEYVFLANPFADTINQFSRLDAVQKDITSNDVLLYQVDTVTGAQVLLSHYEASEDNPSYRRYFINGLPTNCCGTGTTAQVTAMAKMDFVPVVVDQDWLLIGNIPALKLECEAVRYEEMDNPAAQAMAKSKHKQAIKMLNDELSHYMGRTAPIVNFAPFGTAKLERVNIGMI